jgi:outer membrane protein TolC
LNIQKKGLLYFCFALMSTSVQAGPISFDIAWQQLLSNSDRLKASAAKVEQARGELDSTSSLNYPSLDITANYSYMEKPLELDVRDLNPFAESNLQLPIPLPDSFFVTPFTEQDIFSSSLNAMWPIYVGGKIDAAQGIRSAQVQEQKQQLILDQREMFVKLTERYYGVILTQELLKTQSQLKTSLKQHLHHAELMEKQGQIAKVERLSARVSFDKAVLDFNNAKRTADMSQVALNHLLMSPNNTPVSDMFVLQQPPALVTMQQAVKDSHPAILLLQSKQKQAEDLISIQQAGYKPTVFLYGNHTLYNDDTLLADITPDWVVGVGMKIPIFSREGHGGKVRAAKSALAQARYMSSQTAQDLQLLLQQSYNKMLGANDEIVSLNSTLALATENRRLRDIAFKQGLSTSLERVDAEIKLLGARIQQLLAEYNYLVALAKLSSITGDIEDFLFHAQQAGLSTTATPTLNRFPQASARPFYSKVNNRES